MGTYYKITFKEGQKDIIKPEIDSLLVKLNASFSTYEPHAIISQFNDLGQIVLSRMEPLDLYFIEVFERSKYWYEKSDGFFDPTVMPLVNYWGFGYQEKMHIKKVDHALVKELTENVGLSKLVALKEGGKFTIVKPRSEMELDFSAIAKGYAVDQIGKYLLAKGIKDYLVDIGGELVSSGKNPKGKSWVVGISKPLENLKQNEVALLVNLQDRALASSGNYRNFYQSEGQKYSHTINPKTGYPERSHLLGVSVITDNCMDADAIATSCMVMGLEKSKNWVEQLKTTEACFIYNDSDTLAIDYSLGFSKHLVKP